MQGRGGQHRLSGRMRDLAHRPPDNPPGTRALRARAGPTSAGRPATQEDAPFVRYQASTRNSMRRLRARPCGVALSATGRSGPTPLVLSAPSGMPRCTR